MKKKLNNMFMVAIGFFVALFLLSFLFGCKTTKTVTETIHTRDTLTIHHTDTVKEVKLQIDSFIDWKVFTIHDTVFHEREKELVLNEKGDTIKQKEKENLWHKTHENESTQHSESHTDSTSYYKAEVEKLKQALVKEQSKEKVVKKNIAIPWWAWIVLPLILLAGGGVIVRKILYKRWHIS